jgi:ATP-dependent Lhr-like helicase
VPVWWTFAGSSANSALSAGLAGVVDPVSSVNALRLRLCADVSAAELRNAVEAGGERLANTDPVIDDQAADALKFSAAIPRALAIETLRRRLSDPDAVRATISAAICETRIA